MSRAENSWTNMDYDTVVPEGLWYGRYQRAMNGPTGLKRLIEMRDALLALPKKELCEGTLSNGATVCFVGALIAKRVAAKESKPLDAVIETMHEQVVREYGDPADGESWEDLYTTAETGRAHGLPWTVAWEWASLNDSDWKRLSDAERYQAALAWVEERIRMHPAASQ